MPGKVIGIETGFGYPGTIARNPLDITRNHPVKAGADNIFFGDPVIVGPDGTVEKFGATGTAETFAGVAARRVKTAFVYPDQSIGYYMEKEPCDVVLRGNVSVQINAGTPAICSVLI